MTVAPGRARQAEIYLGGARGRRPAVPVDPARLEAAARRKLSRRAYAYIAGGAGSESTVAANRRAFEQRRIVPRLLRDVSATDLSVELFGRRLAAPLLLAPIGVLELAHPEADVAVARAAAAEGVPLVVSSQASRPLEECAAAMGESPRWFQLYWPTSDELAASFVRRAEACGCEAIVLTLDTKLLGWRPRDLDLAHLPMALGRGLAQYAADPVFQRLVDQAPAERAGPVTPRALRSLVRLARSYPGGLLANLGSGRALAAVRVWQEIAARPSLVWEDVARLRRLTRLPLLVKGVLHPEDARRSLEHGVDGIVVSNHGGRQVDGAIASLDALPAVARAVAGRVPILLDGGVRGGADVFKALALGASAVLLGRPYVYGLALAGERGVREVIRNVVAELDLTLALAGFASVRELGPECLQSEA